MLLLSGNMIGTIVAQSSAGYLLKITDDNWPLVFYACGVVGLIWYVFWNLLVYSSPNEHPTITDYELAYLERNLKGVNKNKVNIHYCSYSLSHFYSYIQILNLHLLLFRIH